MGLRLFGLAKVMFFSFFVLSLIPYSSSAQSERPRLNVDQLVEDDQPPIIVPHSELDWLNCSPVEWPQVQEVDNPMHCEA